MKDINVKKTLVFSILLLLIGAVFIPNTTGDNIFSNNEPVEFIIENYDNTMEIEFEINEFEESFVDIEGKEYSKIIIGEESNLLLTGKPDIPNVCRSILIPVTEIDDWDGKEDNIPARTEPAPGFK